MPKKQTNELFVAEPSEWTKRKHRLLERYCVPASQMMKKAGKRSRVALIDGFAGPNKYGDQVYGSTCILITAALRVIEAGGEAIVYAFEVDKDRFRNLEHNLEEYISRGILRALNCSHADGVEEVLLEIGETPLFVFLDPQTPSELSIQDDIAIYADRPRTDILGIFHACNAARIVSSCLSKENASSFRMHPRKFLGDNWEEAFTEEGAIEVFWDEISQMKRYCGIYQLRKKLKKYNAYAIFGLSDHPNGFYLLSDAVAKDYEELERHEVELYGGNLYEEEERDGDMQKLVDILSPFTNSCEKIIGRSLALAAIEGGYAYDLFGLYTERDYNRAAKIIRERLRVSSHD